MTTARLDYSEAELLASDDVETPLVAGGRRCHGGFDADGRYHSPRTRFRTPAIVAWQDNHRRVFGTEILDVPLASWPESYPNVEQAKYLLRSGVPGPIITTLTRIGTVEGFGAMIRYAAVSDPQRFFEEPIAGTAIAHLDGGLLEAHARDEAGWEEEAGHRDMWFAARDVAFETPPTEDETSRMLERMGLPAAGGAPDPGAVRQRMLDARVFSDIDLGLEMLIQRMINILLIEISAFHMFAWAEAVLSDTELVAGDGEAARLVSYIRADETPHVEYLKTALTEMRERTFIGESGRRYPGTDIIVPLWGQAMAASLGPNREQGLRTSLREVEFALVGHPRGDDLLEEFHTLGSIRPTRAVA
ncbi:MAG TPA: hypothetical protein VFF40_13965 [Acidimicrobiia bacterium]|nr:hypothetical protein [Acidimicrobiia bacterium]